MERLGIMLHQGVPRPPGRGTRRALNSRGTHRSMQRWSEHDPTPRRPDDWQTGGGSAHPGSPWDSASLNVLQSRGGSLHLPLLQKGACPFPSTPLFRVLRLVTPTVRERTPMLPRLRLVAVSQQRVQVRRACLAAIAVDRIDFHPIIVVQEQPTGGTAPTLLFEQRRQSRTAPWVPSLSRAPIDPSPA